MFMQNLHGQTDKVALATTVARTTTANGAGVDCQDYEGEGVAQLWSALGTGTTPTLDVKVQDSDDNSSFADVTGAVFAQVTQAAESRQNIGLDLNKLRRFIRFVFTIGGTTPSFTCGGQLIAQKKYQ